MTGSGEGEEDGLELACGDVDAPGEPLLLVDADDDADGDALVDADGCGAELDDDVASGDD